MLADRVGIIDAGRLVAEGTPEDLKRQVGADLIIAKIDADDDRINALHTSLSKLDLVSDVAVHDGELTVSASDGAAVINDLVVALNGAGLRAQSLTLRTPTLDDVFLAITGQRMAVAAGDGEPSDAEGAPA